MPDQVTALSQTEALIRANAHLSITIVDVATSVGTSPRSLQHLFRQHHGLTPTTFLRLVRLAGAHHELANAQDRPGPTAAASTTRDQWPIPPPVRAP